MWEILVKLDDDNQSPGVRPWKKNLDDYEISVIKKDNKHGHVSWGWADGNNKIVLYSPVHFGTPLTSEMYVTKVQWEQAMGVSQAVCSHLNGG